MKKYIHIIATCLTLSACDSFNDLDGVKEIKSISVNVALDFNIDHVAEIKDLTLKFDNYDEALHYEKVVSGEQIRMDDILPATCFGIAQELRIFFYTFKFKKIQGRIFCEM